MKPSSHQGHMSGQCTKLFRQNPLILSGMDLAVRPQNQIFCPERDQGPTEKSRGLICISHLPVLRREFMAMFKRRSQEGVLLFTEIMTLFTITILYFSFSFVFPLSYLTAWSPQQFILNHPVLYLLCLLCLGSMLRTK